MCVLQLSLTLCNIMDWSLPDSSVYGTLQARILEWIASPSSRGSSQPRARTCVSYFLHWQAGSLLLVPPRKHNSPEHSTIWPPTHLPFLFLPIIQHLERCHLPAHTQLLHPNKGLLPFKSSANPVTRLSLQASVHRLNSYGLLSLISPWELGPCMSSIALSSSSIITVSIMYYT